VREIKQTVRDAIPKSGKQLALLLTRAWQDRPPDLCVSPMDLQNLVPLALRSGTAGLAWWRIQSSQLAHISSATRLKEAYKIFTIYSAVHERNIKTIFQLFRSHGIEPILIKGWAIARLYPALGLRPYGDIDLCVPLRDNATAKSLIESQKASGCNVDLIHEEITYLGGQCFEDLYSRSCLVELDDIKVRIPSPEDHLRILCLHFLKHGARIPLGLCDVAVALESRTASFDWVRCLGEHRKQAHWTACTLALAHQLLGANVGRIPSATTINVPGWLGSYVLRQWQNPYAKNLPTKFASDVTKYLVNPTQLWRDLRDRWPNRIEASMAMRVPLNGVPRFTLQLANCVLRAGKLLGEAIGSRA